MSMMVSVCAVLFYPRDVLDEILNLIESVSEGFPSYSYTIVCLPVREVIHSQKLVNDLVRPDKPWFNNYKTEIT